MKCKKCNGKEEQAFGLCGDCLSPTLVAKQCSCESGLPIVARGMCKICYDKWYRDNKNNPDVTFRKIRSVKRKPKEKKPHDFPRKHIVTVWETSDGREWSDEVEALRHEVELFRKR